MVARQIVLFFSVLLNLVLLYSLVWGSNGVLAYKQLREHSEKLQVQMGLLDEQNLALSQEIRLLQSDDKYLEKVIRNRLNYVRESEILYIFPEQKDTDTSGVGSDETKN